MPGGPCSTLQRGSKHTMQAHGATKRHAHSWLWALAVLQGWWKGKFNSFLGDSMVQDHFHHPCGQTGHRLDTVSPIQVFSKAPKSPPLQASVWPEAHLAVTAALPSLVSWPHPSGPSELTLELLCNAPHML